MSTLYKKKKKKKKKKIMKKKKKIWKKKKNQNNVCNTTDNINVCICGTKGNYAKSNYARHLE